MTDPVRIKGSPVLGRKRSGTEVRQRKVQVGVRFTDAEYVALRAIADRQGTSVPSVVRWLCRLGQLVVKP